jgi:Flp pilus assembly protein CpaB
MAIQSTSTRRSSVPFTILGVVLAVLGFGLVLLVGSLTGGHSPSSAGAQQDVVVAAADLPIRTPIEAKDVKVVKYSSGDVPPGAFAKVADVQNLVAAVAIQKGQPLTGNVLVKSGDSVVGAQSAYLPVPTGYVAMTIPTGEQEGVAGYIQAGDYISLVAIVKVKQIDTQNVRTIYTNVHVLRIGPAPADSTAQATKGGISSSLTIVVTQCQAEYVNWFIKNEQLNYTLESYKDYKPQDASVDASCPSVTAAGGVHESDVIKRWPGINGS